ncbi:diguanylate cyclase [Metabacillus litoralis]|uniref:Diguanylate cyclase n=1 Tax=Metabacillus litoralis TaxID=152268 RepID=A0A5C6W2C2_9BACI|nr:sensor domain-containing diguanylate cyclase [Metabacillus litoralis]TXC89872.1 diguanylate cyclase [Metabacillus litoralis]
MKLLFYCILYLIPACIFIYMAGMVYSRNRHSAKHITCSLLYVFTSMWFLGVFTTFIAYPKYFDGITIYWVNGAITISSLLSLHLWLMNANMYAKKKGKYLKLLFVPGVVMLLTLPIDSWMLRSDTNLLEPTFIPGPGLYLLWIVDFSYLTFNLILTVIEMKKGNNAAKLWYKGMLLYFVWTFIMLVAALIFQNTNLYFFIYFIPHGSLFWAVAIFLSMSKFDYLSSYEKRYNILFQRSPLGILIMDIEAKVLEASPQIFQYLGVKREELVNKSIVPFLGEVDKEIFIKKYQKVFMEETKVENLELTFVNKLIERKTLLVDYEFILVEGKTLQFVMLKDITEAKTKEERVRYLAYHDILTGLSNRAAFEKQISELLNRKEKFNLLLMDLNKLKRINDTFGHQAGDYAIKHIANILQEFASENDHAARLGGDEFVMLLSADGTENIIKKIQKQLATPLTLSDQNQLHLSASIGVSSYPADGVTMDQLYSVADKRMYAEKHKGKNS